MDYTPISVRRVLFGFSLTALTAVLPLLVVMLRSSPWSGDAFTGGVDGYRWVMLGVGGVIGTMALVSLAALAWLVSRRAAGRPSGA
ncbi:MAG: hypothetical protein JWP31_2627 [Aeromicrobium sp.]|nr:hypothetical protein [Aeromicrobium sp.]